jgi:hypothetical protein
MEFGRMPKRGFEDFSEGEIVEGRHVGTFRIENFDRLCGMNCVFLKEVNPRDHDDEGPNPALCFTEDMIKKLGS